MPSGSAPRAIGVFPDALAAGNAEPSLAEALGADATQLRRAFLRDTLVAAAMLPNALVTLFHPPGAAARYASLAPPGVERAVAEGAIQSEILQAALERLLATSPVAVLLEADAPLLSPLVVQQACEAVESGSADVAVGPTSAGGCYLLVANAGCAALFEDVDSGTGRIAEQLHARARSAGLRVMQLPERHAIDDMPSLKRLAQDLASDEELWAEATRSALRDLRDAGLPVPEGAPPWTVQKQEVIYSTPWRTLVNDRLATHAGEQIEYAYLQTAQAVWVVPVTPDGRILLVRQYRHPIGRFIVEVPAGGGDGDPEEIARRELAEETGGRAGELIRVASYYPSSAHVSHRGDVYVALDVEPGSAALESTELLWSFSVPFELALDMARRGEIGDSQSALAILAAEPVIRAALRERGVATE